MIVVENSIKNENSIKICIRHNRCDERKMSLFFDVMRQNKFKIAFQRKKVNLMLKSSKK